jgi:hypothetical protein
VVAFHQHGVVTLGDDCVVPGGFHDAFSLQVRIMSFASWIRSGKRPE